MARKSAALNAIKDELSIDAMEQASGGTSLLPAAMPTVSGKWDPALVGALPEVALAGAEPPAVVELQETLKAEFEPQAQEANAPADTGVTSDITADETANLADTGVSGVVATANTGDDGAFSALRANSGLPMQDIPINGTIQVGAKIAGGIGDIGKGVGDVVKDVGGMFAGGVADAANKVADTVAETAKDVGGKIADGAVDAANKVADTVTEAAKDVGGRIADGAMDAADKAADAALDVAKTAGTAAFETAQEVGRVMWVNIKEIFRGW